VTVSSYSLALNIPVTIASLQVEAITSIHSRPKTSFWKWICPTSFTRYHLLFETHSSHLSYYHRPTPPAHGELPQDTDGKSAWKPILGMGQKQQHPSKADFTRVAVHTVHVSSHI